uniref:Helicase ATP-binding domain-containing protein n=1 Tax=Ciona savignyi TaxID=51511 RepID=H2YE12_CIOSA
VHPAITMHLKPHQVEGVQFIWGQPSGEHQYITGGFVFYFCISFFNMMITITSIHTILRTEELSIKTVLVVAPLNTLLNWMAEFERWAPDDEPIMVGTYNLADYGTRKERLKVMEKWSKTGGVMVLGYDMFRLLASGRFAHLLLDPGPDIVVCDEGHKLKNSESNISIVMNKLKTKRRLVLTGTPLQNNLIEYQCMVNFVKPNLLGSIKEFRNRFVNPISNGQHLDSTERDVRLMKKRSHVLHDMLQGFVQRKDYTSLAQYLCGKYEFIIKVRLSPMQVKLYRHYLDTMTNRGSDPHAVVQGSKDTGLFSDYQNLMRIWTHPRVLQLHTIRRRGPSIFAPTSAATPPHTCTTQLPAKSCIRNPVPAPVYNQPSGDHTQCAETGSHTRAERSKRSGCNLDYFRMDGSSLGKSRQRWINEFNDETDRRARLFLISTKAGSLGVNLVAANRVVIFDASWNPTHDIQSIFRVYRFGQVKCCFIYRLIAQGTMEEKIYDRQVTKQSLAFRVVDEQQINRHFTAHDLQELYNF